MLLHLPIISLYSRSKKTKKSIGSLNKVSSFAGEISGDYKFKSGTTNSINHVGRIELIESRTVVDVIPNLKDDGITRNFNFSDLDSSKTYDINLKSNNGSHDIVLSSMWGIDFDIASIGTIDNSILGEISVDYTFNKSSHTNKDVKTYLELLDASGSVKDQNEINTSGKKTYSDLNINSNYEVVIRTKNINTSKSSIIARKPISTRNIVAPNFNLEIINDDNSITFKPLGSAGDATAIYLGLEIFKNDGTTEDKKDLLDVANGTPKVIQLSPSIAEDIKHIKVSITWETTNFQSEIKMEVNIINNGTISISQEPPDKPKSKTLLTIAIVFGVIGGLILWIGGIIYYLFQRMINGKKFLHKRKRRNKHDQWKKTIVQIFKKVKLPKISLFKNNNKIIKELDRAKKRAEINQKKAQSRKKFWNIRRNK